jgi:hypothetical protein
MVNTLTRKVGASFGPIVLETLVKHYFERLKKEVPDRKQTTKLRRYELLYDQAFNIVKVSSLENGSFTLISDYWRYGRIFSPPLRCACVIYSGGSV